MQIITEHVELNLSTEHMYINIGVRSCFQINEGTNDGEKYLNPGKASIPIKNRTFNGYYGRKECDYKKVGYGIHQALLATNIAFRCHNPLYRQRPHPFPALLPLYCHVPDHCHRRVLFTEKNALPVVTDWPGVHQAEGFLGVP